MAIKTSKSYQYTFAGAYVLVTAMQDGVSGPVVYSARWLHQAASLTGTGFGATEAEAVTDLFRLYRDKHGMLLPGSDIPDD